MSTIRRQSIVSSVVVYSGFALGLFNTYLFTRKGGFTEEQYGLTSIFIAIANIMYSVAALGMPSYISKFFPYYNSHLRKEKNDQLTWALLVPLAAFIVVIAAGLFFKNILIDKIFNNSPELLQYYYWTFPFGLGLTLFIILESYAWQQRKAVLSNFSREVLFRFFTTILIVFTTVGIINSFDIFIKIYSFLYLLLAAILISYFAGKGKFHFVFEISKVTRRFSKKIITLCSFVWGGSLVYTLALVFDTIVIAAVMPNGAAAAGIFFLAQNISALIQAPQRGIISASIGPLSQAWKEKNYKKINLIYHRSSINQLIFSCAMFCLIWLNFTDGVYTFDLKETYLQGQMVFLFIGLARIIDMGTGVNAQIIATSNYWRFEFITGIALLAITLPLSYILAREIGIIGPAVASLVALIIYNGIRFFFLYSKFKMQPFTLNSLYTLMLAAFAYFIAFILFRQHTGLVWIIARSSLFIAIYGCGMVLLKLTPDLKPVLVSVKRKLRL